MPNNSTLKAKMSALKNLRADPDSCAARVEIQVSPAFWGWVFQFRGKLQITNPQKLIDTCKALLEAARE